jgi:hypothetical protein
LYFPLGHVLQAGLDVLVHDPARADPAGHEVTHCTPHVSPPQPELQLQEHPSLRSPSVVQPLLLQSALVQGTLGTLTHFPGLMSWQGDCHVWVTELHAPQALQLGHALVSSTVLQKRFKKP